MFLVFSFSGVASAFDEKGALLVKPEMQLSLVCENEEVRMTFVSLENGIIAKEINRASIHASEDITFTLVSQENGIVLKKTGKDAIHENISFKGLQAGNYKLLVDYKGNVTAQEFEVR